MRARTSPRCGALSECERSRIIGVMTQLDNSDEIDPFVQEQVPYTNGFLYRPLQYKLSRASRTGEQHSAGTCQCISAADAEKVQVPAKQGKRSVRQYSE